jgi:hypothetical protein
MKDSAEMSERIQSVFASQRLAVLATQDHGQPYSNLMPCAATPDLKHLVFATPGPPASTPTCWRTTGCRSCWDNRSNKPADWGVQQLIYA